jgi:hypothetical protein
VSDSFYNLNISAMYDIKTIIEQGEEYYHSAQEELFKPEEDVVHYMVCRSAYKATHKFLTGFLMQKGTQINSKLSLEELLKMCRKINPKFNALKLDPFFHATEEEDVWMNLGTAKDFLGMATETRKLVQHA